MRDLERLHDVVEYRINASQLKLVFLGVLAVACAIFAVGVSVGKRLDPVAPALAPDPLAELARLSAAGGAPGAVARTEAPALTYHDELSGADEDDEPEAAPAGATPDGEPVGEPAPGAAAAEVAGTPAGRAATPAMDVETEPAHLEEPEPGESAVYTLQVASFETRDEAMQFATDLRARGHHVFLVRTATEDRGTWFRVRVGPFTSRREATAYQRRFERTERLPTFLVRRAH